VAELADAQASGACGLWPVEVRLLSSAFTGFVDKIGDFKPLVDSLYELPYLRNTKEYLVGTYNVF
jgi:hypothetical protein